MDLVNNRVLVPESVRCACDLLHSFNLPGISFTSPLLDSADTKDMSRLDAGPQSYIVVLAPVVVNAV